MRQSWSNIYRNGSDWHRHRCNAYIATNTDHLEVANANQAENWSDCNVRRRVCVSTMTWLSEYTIGAWLTPEEP